MAETRTVTLTWMIANHNAREFVAFFTKRGFTLGKLPKKVTAPLLELVYDDEGASLFLDSAEQPLCEDSLALLQAFREFTCADFDAELATPVLVPGRKLKTCGKVARHVAVYLKDELRYPVFARVSGYAVQWRYEEPDTRQHYLLCLARDLNAEAETFTA